MSRFYTNVRQYGNQMLVRAVVNGKRKKFKVDYQPYLFTEAEGDTGYKTIYGKNVLKTVFDDIRSCKDYIKRYDGVSGHKFYGMTQFVYPFINDFWEGEIDYDRELINIMSIDIEVDADEGFPDVDEADKEITVITISDGEKFVVIGNGDYTPHRENVEYYNCSTEKELLKRFVTEYQKMDPDIITGWNIMFFDIPYTINRMRRIFGGSEFEIKKLSPWGVVFETKKKNNTSYEKVYNIYGVEILDYLDVYKKWSFVNQESYKLDHIANVELGQGKLDYSEYGSLHNLYVQNYQKYVEYNVLDTGIINRLDDKLKLMDLAIAIAYNSKINYMDSYTSVLMWDVIAHNSLLSKGIVIPQKTVQERLPYVGGYVKDPVIGRSQWVCSFDLNSLYPHLIMQYNISPEKFFNKAEVDFEYFCDKVINNTEEFDKDISAELKERNLAMTPNGCMWSRDGQGFLPELMEKMYVDRSMYKKKMLEAEQNLEDVEKVLAERGM